MRDRVTRQDRPDLGFTTTAYSGATGLVTVLVTETVKATGVADVTRVQQSSFNILGQLTQSIDAYGQSGAVTTSYDYTSQGDLDAVVLNGVTVATMSYNLARHRTQIVEPNSGTTTIAVDALGQPATVTDALSQQTRFTFDDLGRLTQRIDRYGSGNAVTNNWGWDASYGTGQLASRSSPGFTETYSYQTADSKLESIVTDINVAGVHSGTYTHTFDYAADGRLDQEIYPDGSTYFHVYNVRGYRTQLNGAGGTVLQDIQDTDAFGSPSLVSFANGLKTQHGYDAATGRLTSIKTGTVSTPKSIQDLEYQWRTNSTLYTRKDLRNTTTTTDDLLDTFSYDLKERMQSQVTSGGATRTLSFGYDVYGNLTSKTSSVSGDLNVTAYGYGTSGKPHRMTSATIAGIANTFSYDANGNITSYDATTGNDTFLSYDGQNNVTKITVGTSAGTSTPTARDEFWYDPDGQRFLRRQSWDESSVQKQSRVVYVGARYAEVVPVAGGSFDRVQRTDLTPTVRRLITRLAGAVIANRLEYIYRDHLGSVDVITDASGVQLHKPSHDPFGGRRHGNWLSDITSMTNTLAWEDERFYRGFTDHEQLNRTGFIHMNGRVYDPRIGRFVSPDPIVQSPTFSQSYNRYAYVFNSPLSYTDPSGFAGTASRLRTQDGSAGHGGFSSSSGGSGVGGEGRTGGRSLFSFLNSVPGVDAHRPIVAESGHSQTGGGPGSSRAGSSAMGLPEVVDVSWSGAEAASVGVRLAEIGVPGYASARAGNSAFDNGSYVLGSLWYAASGGEVALAVVTFGTTAVAFAGARLAARGTSRLGGIITSTTNSAGGTVVTATGRVVGSDFAGAVNGGMLRGGPVNILSGAHGEISGVMRAERAFFNADRAAFGHLPGVNVLDVTRMAPGEISGLLRGPGTTIGAFCDSGACLAPFR